MIKCAIIDDEPLAIKLIETYISKLDQLALVASHSNPLEGLATLKTTPVDLLFLDIQMPELSGVQLARILPDNIQVIFTTAYPDYAVEGFELKALDYLLKPISLYRFIDAVERYKALPTPASSFTEDKKFIFVKTEYRQQKINLDEIYYLKGMGDYCQIILQAEKIMTLEKMQSFETRLPSHLFRRVHKSYLIAINKIEYVEKNKMKIKDELIPIGKTYENNIKDFLE